MADQYVGPSEAPDRYRLVELVGRGAEGEVWRAEAASGPAATMAVKVLVPPEGSDVGTWAGAWRDRIGLLRSEAQPGIVAVRDSFLGAPPHPVTQADVRLRPAVYVVSDWIDGPNLRAWVAGRSDGELRTIGFALLAQVSAALDGLHSGAHTEGRPVAHLDVKPENVLVDRRGEAWLGDFGLARVLGGATTSTGYTPPEVRHGGDHWPASDRYSLGGLAYFLATRQDPPVDPAPGELRQALLASPVLGGSQDAIDQLLVMLDPEPRKRPFPSRAWADGITAALATIPQGGTGAGWGAVPPAVAGGALAGATLAGAGTPPPPPPGATPPPPLDPTAAGPEPTAPMVVPAAAAGAYAGGAQGGPPGGPGQPPGFGAPPPPQPPKKNRAVLVAAVVVVVLLAAGAAAFLLTRDSGTKTGSGSSTDSAPATHAPTTDSGPSTDSSDTNSDTTPVTDAPITDAPTTPTTLPAKPAVCGKVGDITAVTTEIQNANTSGDINQIKQSIAHGAQIFADLAAVAPPEIKSDADFVAGSWYRYSQAVNAVVPGDQASSDNLKAAVTQFSAENAGPEVKAVDAYLAKHC